MKATDSFLKSEDRVDLTAMIDVVFLLLIYFMVTTTIMKQESDIGLKLPSDVPAAADTPLPEEHLVDILADGGILFNGAPIGDADDRDLPELVGLLTRVRESSERAGFKTLVLLNPEPSTPQQDIVNVLNACVEAGVTSVTFASEA
ncbi:MAG: ExbD/TolR family protein [Opitutales bacterium]